MARQQNELTIKLTLLADDMKQGLVDIKQRLDDLHGAGSGAGDVAAEDAKKNLGGISQSAKDSEASVKTLSSQINSAKNAVLGFLGISIGAELIKKVVDISDTYSALRAKIKEAAGENANYALIQAKLFTIAQASNAPLEDTVNLYARTAAALKNTGASQETVLKMTEAVNLSFKASGSSASEISSTITQLTQAISTDTVQWEDFGQLADTNIRLVNVAAKNLGYDGLGAMKKAMSDGKVTNVQLVNALTAGFGDIKKAADKMPVSFRGSMTILSNAFTKLIGESSDTTTIVGKLSKGIQFLADNIKPVVTVVTLLAELYGTKLVLGFIESTKQLVEAKKAVEEKTEADKAAMEVAQGTLQSEARIAQIRVQTTATLVEEARLQRALATTEEQRRAAVQGVSDALAAQANAQQAADEAAARLAANTQQSTAQVSRLAGALEKLKKLTAFAFSIKIAVDAVGGVLETLGQYNEKVRFYRYAWEATIEEVEAVFIHFFSGDFLDAEADSLRKKFEVIQQKYGDLAVAASDAVVKQTAAEAEKSKATEKATLEQKASFEQQVKSIEALTASWDAQLELQTAALETHLTNRKVEIDASDAGDVLRNRQKLLATMDSYLQEQQLYATAANAKLLLIDTVYQQQIAKQKAGSDRAKELEQAGMNERKDIYSQLAAHYSTVLDKLQQEYNQEITAAAESKRSLRALATDHEFSLADIERQGMGARAKISSEETEFDSLMAKAKQELKKGEKADQEKLNALLSRAKELHGQLTGEVISTAKTEAQKSEARWQAADRLNTIYEVQKTLLQDNSKEHGNNAAAIEKQMKPVNDSLTDANTKLTELTNELNKAHILTVGVDAKAVTDVIANIVKPTSSTHTINVVTVNSAEAHAAGGLIKGKGTGTSDEIPALLSNGEYVIPADIVAKNGVAVFDAIRSGKPVQKFADGGLVGDDDLKKKADEFKKQAYEQAKAIFDDPKNQIIWRMSQGQTSTGSADPNNQQKNFERRIGDYLKANNLPIEWRDLYLKGEKAETVLRTTKASFEDKAKAQAELDNQFSPGKTPDKQATIPSVGSNAQTASIPRVSTPAMIPPVTTGTLSLQPSLSSVVQTGKVSTVKFEGPDGKSTVGHSNDPDFEKFFAQMNTISGVTKV